MEEKKCTGDCLRCSFQQQVYCAAQHGHAVLAVMPNLVERLERIEGMLARFTSAPSFINPLKDGEAQGGAGAENRAPEL